MPKTADNLDTLKNRTAPLNMPPEEFRKLGHKLVDRVAELLGSISERPVTPGERPSQVKDLIQASSPLPDSGDDAGKLLDLTTDLLFEHSLFNGHPKFFGYITSSAAPIGALGELLAAAVNANCGAYTLSPIATEIELQTVKWIAELIGLPSHSGLLVSGGNMANLVGVWAARTAHAKWDIRKLGLADKAATRLRIYASTETHTWIQKAADLMGFGTDSIVSIDTGKDQRMLVDDLRKKIAADRKAGHQPWLVVGSAGTVSTGVIDPLDEIAEICRKEKLWFHVDGAYGGFGAAVPELADAYRGMEKADSVAVDPHKWLYAPLEAGCTLVRDPEALRNAFSYHPPYYHFDEEAVNFVDMGPQNSRGFRALKVWLALQQVGRSGYVKMISDDIKLADAMYRELQQYNDFETVSVNLSITTFRYIPDDLKDRVGQPEVDEYLDELNQETQARLEKGGELFVSGAVVNGKYVLRPCIVNFRTSLEDVTALPHIIRKTARAADSAMRSQLAKA
jgi:glutamate/tyrosine decarboxylase-like PLP-dependent enzyme